MSQSKSKWLGRFRNGEALQATLKNAPVPRLDAFTPQPGGSSAVNGQRGQDSQRPAEFLKGGDPVLDLFHGVRGFV